MPQIEAIQEYRNAGMTLVEIAQKLKISEKTIRKYIRMEKNAAGEIQKQPVESKLDRWKAKIDAWMEEDRRMRFKQRHTAKRIHERLREEYGQEYNASYPLVQRYVKKKREEVIRDAGSLELVWHPGEAQADFGEADFIENGMKKTLKYLCVTFPHSNAGYVQVFRGETAECVAQGLRDIFHRIGGVPIRIVFDNATGVGRRFRDKVRFADFFLRFKIHYGFSASFCNPESGNEKGNVENKVGYIRRNLFVPMPAFEDLEEFNRELLSFSEKDWNRPHYKLEKTIAELFEEEKRKLADLPEYNFSVERLERVRTDGYGKFCLDGRHYYSSNPDLAHSDVVVGIGAHTVRVYDQKGGLLSEHRRSFGERRTDQTDYRTTIEKIIHKPAAWKNSQLRENFPEELKTIVDRMTKEDLRDTLRALGRANENYSLETAMRSLMEAVRRGSVKTDNVLAICARIELNGLDAIPDAGPDLSRYDRAFIGEGGGQCKG
ncbi:MAG: Integrase core domain protein [Deltaproteobacteria bacterium ADurb.Bin151]|nr:MAG: Integrase core domain protein [Deltaproteobacteria bacterium ADurb.Bin151]